MLHSPDTNLLSNHQTIKLTSSVHTRPQPVVRHLRSTLVASKDHISNNKNNDIMVNRSMNIQKKESTLDGSNHKRERVISHYNDTTPQRNKEVQNQRQSLLASSREIRRMTMDYDENKQRSNEKVLPTSHSKIQYRTPVLKKEQTHYTSATNYMLNQSEGLSAHERTNFQNQIQELMNRLQYFENQCRNLKAQNEHLHRSLGAPKQILQRELENKVFRIEDVEKRLETKTKEYLQKCLENQKHIAKVTELQNTIRKLQFERDKTAKQLQWQKQTVKNLTKQLNDAKNTITKVEGERKKALFDCEQERIKVKTLEREKRTLELELEKISKIKQLVRELEKSDEDKAEVIKKHIAYEVELIDLNCIMQANLQTHKHDLKVTQEQHQNINNQIEAITQQIAVKLKDVLDQKQRVQDQLAEARAETERIRKSMFEGYQDVIANLKDEIIKLKEENVNLSSNSESKITIVKLEREVKLLQGKVDDLMIRNKQLQEAFERLRQKDYKRSHSDIPTETSIKAPQYYDRTGPADLESIIMTYQTRSMDLNSRIQQKEMNQLHLKHRLEQLEGQIRQLKSQSNFSSKKEKTDTENIKIQLQSMKMQLKSQTDSLNRKIQALEKNIQRKNKQIKEKDNFITHYLIQKVKGEVQVKKIVQEIDKYFNEVQGNNKK